MDSIKKFITNLCRLILAVTFIFSGYVKAVDPLGTQYKIQDYLEALSLQGYVPDWVTLGTSVGLSALEFSLGIFMLFAICRRRNSRLVLIFMLVMTLISLWLVVANPIKDCGCFGDAVKLTNAETFGKNIVLLACAVVVAIYPLRMVRFISKSNQWIVINFTIVYILATSAVSIYRLPWFDFRPYHVGANILKGMEMPPRAQAPQFETTFILQKNGVKKEFSLDNYPDSTWQFVDSKTVQTRDGYVPPIHDFSIQTAGGEDITQQVLTDKGYTFLLIAPHLELANETNFGDIDQIYEYAQAYNVPFYCLTASNEQAISHWEDITGAEYPFCTTDETTLKTIVRSNPGLVLLKNGTVINKWSHNELPQTEELTAPLAELSIGRMPANSMAGKITKIFLWFILPLILLTLADRLWSWSKWVRAKEQRIKRDIPTFKKEKENEKENCCRQLENEHEPAGRRDSGQGD